MRQVIELHCSSTGPQPDELIADIIKGTGLESRDAIIPACGPWVWDYGDVDEAVWVNAQPILRVRIMALYESNKIRYGSW